LTPAAYAAYAFADHCLERVVEAARAAGVLERTTFFILSDHGFATYTHSISPNVALIERGLIHKNGDTYTSLRASLVPKLKAYFLSVPGIEHIYTNEEARSIGLPSRC
jgi:predicted AlkP superfamily pyrophosphatase or phosphodiesterase